MKYSDNFKFNLPNKADGDSADIDPISDNFRRIDEILKKMDNGDSDGTSNYFVHETDYLSPTDSPTDLEFGTHVCPIAQNYQGLPEIVEDNTIKGILKTSLFSGDVTTAKREWHPVGSLNVYYSVPFSEQNWSEWQVYSDGLSAYEIWLQQGNTGSEADFLKSLKGADYVLTEADKAEIAQNATSVCIAKNQGASNVGKILAVGTDGNITLVDMPEGGASGDVVGVLDESNNILLSGNLADGTYKLKYENENGTVTDIGDLVVSSITDYAIIPTLENCTSSGATSVRVNGSATVTITANGGYALPDSITVSGASYTWDKSTGNIVLSNPTSDVYITVTAEKTITNFIEYNTDNTKDWSIWCNDARVGSDGAYRSSTTQDATNYIFVQNGDIIYINQGRMINGQTIGLYNSSKAYVSTGATTDLTSNGHISDATSLNANTLDAQFTITNASVAFIRFTLLRSYTVADDEIVVNIKRNGEWL